MHKQVTFGLHIWRIVEGGAYERAECENGTAY